MAVLLIGSTGMGKSAFGNFLINPDDDHIFKDKKQTFAVATDNTPMTQEVQIAHKEVLIDFKDDVVPGTCTYLTVIDTPGLNESAEKDLSHMIQIVKKLNEVGQIQACILVIKFNAKIDAQYKATMKYYSRLLPGLFDNNVIIVMTDFATDNRSERMRSKQNIDVSKVRENTASQLSQCTKELSYSPVIFMLDCLPMDDQELETSKKQRISILKRIFSREAVNIKEFTVAKTPYLQEIDNGIVKELEGKIKGYNIRLQECHEESKEALNETEKKEIEIAKTEAKLKDLIRNRDDKDKPDKVVAKEYLIEESWKFLHFLKHNISFETDCDITGFKTWTNGNCLFNELAVEARSVNGKVEGKFMRGIYASVTVFTKKQLKYAAEIAQLNEEIEKAKKNLQKCKEARDEMQQRHKKHMEQIKMLQKFINDNSEEIQVRSINHMTVDEALARLAELETSLNQPKES